MAEYLIILIPCKGEEQASWAVLKDDGSLAALPEKGELSSHAATLSAGRRVVLVVPGDDVLLTEVVVPSQKRQRILRAVPFAVEDQVADEVENLHFALGPRREGDAYPVAVVGRGRLQGWLDQAASAGLSVDMVVPDTLLVPEATAGWNAVVDGNRVLFRTGAYAAFTTDRENAATMVALAGKTPPPALLTQYVCRGDALTGLPEGLESVQAACDGGLPALLAGHFRAGLVIDLLQGDFSRKEQVGQLWRPWRISAALLLSGLLLVMVQMGLEYRTLNREHQELSQRIEQVYREIFPDAKRIVNPRAQMEQRLAELRRSRFGGEEGFLELLRLCGGILHAMEGVQMQGASYREGRLDLDITAGSLQVLDQLKQQLAGTGSLEVEIQSATADDKQQVQSRLRLRKVGA